MGRSAECEVVLDSAAVSRRHARLGLRDGVPVVVDLGSANGVFVNGRRFEGERVLKPGDVIVIGDQELRLHAEPVQPAGAARAAETMARADTLWDDDDAVVGPEENTDVQDAVELLGAVADRFIAAGQARQASDVLGPRLRQLLERARSARGVTPEIAESAGKSAVRLATAIGNPSWIDYVLDLYASIDRMLPEPLLVAMHEAVRRLPRVDLSRLRAYIEQMSAAKLSHHERFVLKRLEGLERVAALR